ncbi:sulfotransferase [Aestuariicella hydrocarbonica]|uniref:Sulfotransferase n=1 Tax=Pseudomaricurvus hydrocarbonicus TaxID=1470433 RepID=A0A9E5MLW6_9GAMM|nr:sulfotransferase [Aestuariicella hydrocarbonica]NHO65663.1 sulfotransferase [Aestuariicella hydrocarbonica]
MTASEVQSKVFRVDEFQNPTLSPERRKQLETIEAEPLDMSVDSVLSAAVKQTGLEDFGDMGFRDRLARILGEVEGDTNTWKISKKRIVATCIKAAANRLKNQEFLKRNPAVDAVEIDRPIFITGLPRSGTTHLENLIAADRRLRYLPVYLGSEAVPTPGEVPDRDGKDPRWVRSNNHWNQMKANPIMAAMHEHSPDHACGENELQIPDFASYQWEWMADVPKWRDFYFSEDQVPHYQYGRTMLKAIAYQMPDDRRWILKGNAQSEQLPALMTVYPDAIVVMTHRDPLAILQSVLTMRGLSVLAHQKVPNIEAHVNYWVDRIEHMLRCYIRDMDKVPDGQRVDLLFQDIMGDDVGTAQRVLTAAGLPLSDDSEKDMRDYMDNHPRGRDGRVVYDLEGNFKLDIDKLRQRFNFYTDRFAVRHEVK